MVTTVAVGELLLNAGSEEAGSDPTDRSLDCAAVVLQQAGGDLGVGREDGSVTGLTTLVRHSPHPAYLGHPVFLALPPSYHQTLVTKIFISVFSFLNKRDRGEGDKLHCVGLCW